MVEQAPSKERVTDDKLAYLIARCDQCFHVSEEHGSTDASLWERLGGALEELKERRAAHEPPAARPRATCEGCGFLINPQACKCTLSIHEHGRAGHVFTPMGCECPPYSSAQPPSTARPRAICKCGFLINPEACKCTISKSEHSGIAHPFAPMGCECAQTEPRDRLTAAFWRDDAFENAALICERYEAHDAARDIRRLKGSSQPPGGFHVGDHVEWTNYLGNKFTGTIERYIVRLDDGAVGQVLETELRHVPTKGEG